MPSIDSIFSTIGSYFFPAVSPSEEVSLRDTLHTSDTVSPAGEASAETWTPERPLLTAPESLPPPKLSTLSDYRLLAAVTESQRLGNGIMETLGVRLSNVKDDIRTISAENIQKLKEAAERANASDFWSILKKIATCLLSAVSIVFGVALLASGGGALIGGAMIASGILSLANFALSEMGTWDWVADQIAHDNEDLKRKIAMILPGAIGIVAGGIGLVGSVYGIASGALQFAEKAMFVAQAALSIFDGVTTLGKGISDARLLWTQADLKMIEAELTVERENFSTLIGEIKGCMYDFKNIKAHARKAVEMITQSNIDLVRQA